jgi:dihydrofolate synthase/folylpolyglutamate synthase
MGRPSVAAGLDAIILEVGLGGRLDAVNVFEPDCAIVTSVAMDHMDYLGDTREAIGFEKAGIFRGGRPAICSDPMPPANP